MITAPQPPNTAILRAYLPVLAILVAGILMSIGAGWWLLAEARRMDAERFEAAVIQLRDVLDERTERYVLELQNFSDRLESRKVVTPEQWRESFDRLAPTGNLPALLELSYLENTSLPSVAYLEKLIESPTREGNQLILPQFSPFLPVIREYWTQGVQCSPADTAQWLTLPVVSNHWTGTLNSKMCSSPKRILTNASGTQFSAVSFFFPLFADDLVELTRKHSHILYTHLREYRWEGLIVATISWEAFLKSSLSADSTRVAFEAFSTTNLSSESWMGDAGSTSTALGKNFKSRFRKELDWPFFRSRWKLVFYSTPEFEELSPQYRGWIVVFGGAALSILMAGLVEVQIRARRKQELISDQLRLALEDLEAARQEREELSHDLHDGTIQSLYALQLGLSRSTELASGASFPLGHRLDDHRKTLTAVIGELRGFILRHEADSGPTGHLAGVLETLIQRLRLSTEKTLITDLSQKAALRLSGEQAVHLANLGREALSNALRHANASTISVSLRGADESVVLEITDDGQGFDPVNPPSKGLGLSSMSARAKQAGGALLISVNPGKGARVSVTVPAGKD